MRQKNITTLNMYYTSIKMKYLKPQMFGFNQKS